MKLKFYFFSTLFIFSSFLFSLTNAQDCTFYLPNKKGAKAEITHFNEKNKKTGKSVYEITDINNSSNEIIATVEVKSFDEKDNLQGSSSMNVTCKNGVFSAEMNNFIAPEMLEAYENFDVKIKSDYLEIPSKVTTGQKLKDGKITVTASNPMLPSPLTISILIKNRIAEGEEKITVPAGTFKCRKMTYTMDSNIIISSQTHNVIDYIAPNVGVVRNEIYDTNGNLKAYSELTSLE